MYNENMLKMYDYRMKVFKEFYDNGIITKCEYLSSLARSLKNLGVVDNHLCEKYLKDIQDKFA